MKKIMILFIFLLGIACQNEGKQEPEQDAGILPVEGIGTDRKFEEPEREEPVLVIATNALQLLNEETGATTDLLFGMEIDQLVDIVNTTVESTYKGDQIDTACGAGPLKMASWENGLVLIFKESKSSGDWEFEGWLLDAGMKDSEKLHTVSGVGIGSTRGELEEDYEIEVKQTNLGQEFSTERGLFGILSGSGDSATVQTMWSGLSCNVQ